MKVFIAECISYDSSCSCSFLSDYTIFDSFDMAYEYAYQQVRSQSLPNENYGQDYEPDYFYVSEAYIANGMHTAQLPKVKLYRLFHDGLVEYVGPDMQEIQKQAEIDRMWRNYENGQHISRRYRENCRNYQRELKLEERGYREFCRRTLKNYLFDRIEIISDIMENCNLKTSEHNRFANKANRLTRAYFSVLG